MTRSPIAIRLRTLPARTALAALCAALLGAGAACGAHGLPTVRDDAGGIPRLDRNFPSGDQAADAAALAGLKQRMTAIAKQTGCAAAGECATMAYGVRGCGGPSGFVVYCRLTTDEAKLRAAADEVTRAEQAFNSRYGVISTCEMRSAPGVDVSGGACIARTTSGAPAGPTASAAPASIRSVVPEVTPR